MTKWLICVDVTAFGYLEVEAESEEAAREMGYEAEPSKVRDVQVTSIDDVPWVRNNEQ